MMKTLTCAPPELRRVRNWTLTLPCLAAALLLPPGFAQQPATPSPSLGPGLVLQESVRRVVVDVVVTDHGKPVTGLTAADFRIFEDGKPQAIRSFEARTPESGEVIPARPAVMPVHTFVNLPAVPTQANAPLTVILYDALNTPFKDQLYARQQLVKFLRQMPVGVPTAIYVLSDRLYLLQGFSGERSVLVRAMTRQNAIPDQKGLLPDADSAGAESPLTPDREGQLSPANSGMPPGSVSSGSNIPGVSSNQPAGMPVPVAGPVSADVLLAQMTDEISSSLLDQRVGITLNAIQQIARALSSVPGRKNLIWLSGSFPDIVPPDESAGPMVFDNERSYFQQIADTDNLLCTSQVAVYPVDARGLMVPMLTSGPGTAQAYASQLAAEQGTQLQIADDTGGTAYFGANDLVKAFQSALDSGSHYYSLTYAPTNPNFNGKLRRIRLEVDHRGYSLAYRRSYFAGDFGQQQHNRSEAQAVAAAQPGSILSALDFGAPEAHDLVFAARVNAVGAPQPASRDQMHGLLPFLAMAAAMNGENFSKPKHPLPLQHYLVQFAVMARELQIPQGSDGNYHPRLSFAAMAYDAQGNPLGGEQTTVDSAIPAAKMAAIQKAGYQASENLFVPLNTASLRIAVRDARSSRIGSLTVALPLAPATH